MNESPEPAAQEQPTTSSFNLKLFLGLSRTPHGVLELATPSMAALLWLGHFPPVSVIVVGLITAFAGYTAVYALNDIVDYRVDKERLAAQEGSTEVFHVDEIMVRHPLAQGLLSYRSGLMWFGFWAAVALAGAWWLNPACAVLFLVSGSLEFVYCKMLKVSYLKIIPSAMVKASGGLAGALAVDPNPSWGFIAVLLLWLAAWEVGGQNIANDIVDMEDDKRVFARTTATVKGMTESVFLVIAAVSMAVMAGTVIYWLSGEGVGWIYPIGAVIIGVKLLLEPARALYREPGPQTAASLFNRAGLMPLFFLGLTLLAILSPL